MNIAPFAARKWMEVVMKNDLTGNCRWVDMATQNNNKAKMDEEVSE